MAKTPEETDWNRGSGRAFQLIYEDDCIAVVNKSPGVSVGADRWDESRERLDKLLAAFLKLEKIYIVHRIDKDTSGLVIFAKDGETHKRLSTAFEKRQVEKRYIAAVHGRPLWTETLCDLPLVPDGNKRHHTIIDRYRGKKALTRFKLLVSAGNYSVLEARPETGKTHQIRVHLAGLGHPVVCDEFYGTIRPVLLSAIKRGWRGNPQEERPLLARLGLHAAELVIPPRGPAGETPGKGLAFEAPLPRDMAALIKQMEKAAGRSVPPPAALGSPSPAL
jgi:23S rRNA pseudouridine1911/1915/1917 synthase